MTSFSERVEVQLLRGDGGVGDDKLVLVQPDVRLEGEVSDVFASE